MSTLYDESHRGLQRRFDTERLADRIEERLLDGNGMFLSMGNVAATGHVGLLFIDLCAPKRLRINGTARIEPAGFVTPAYADAQFVVVVTVREAFPNCPRYIHKFALVERSAFVLQADVPAPIPKWKRMDWARDVLPQGDPARSES